MEDLPLEDISIGEEPVQEPDTTIDKDSRGALLFQALDADDDDSADQEEIATFVARNSKLWTQQSVNFGWSTEKSQQLATQVATELATGSKAEEGALQAKITPKQLHRFRQKYIRDPGGTREFFWRTIFAYYDEDNNLEIDASELDKMLEALYDASFFLEHEGELGGALLDGNLRLPPREELKALVLEETRYSSSHHRGLTFDVFFRFLQDTRKREEAAAEREAAAKERQTAIAEGIQLEVTDVAVDQNPTMQSTGISTAKVDKERLKKAHANQVMTCTALPTMGRNISMFDTRHQGDFQDLRLSRTAQAAPLSDFEEEEEEEDQDEGDDNQHGETWGMVSDFLTARVHTFAKNMETISETVSETLTEMRHNSAQTSDNNNKGDARG